jgi:glycogen debranching enzyme
MAWIDTCLQAVFSAQILTRMAAALGRTAEVSDLYEEIDHLGKLINTTMWDDATGFYYDRRADGSLSDVKTIGAFWALLADVIPPQAIQRFVAHLENPAEFNRPHRVPSLSADHPFYNPLGEYWRGSIWAPTNYMILRGLTQAGFDTLAHQIGLNHHDNVVKVFEQTGTVWENYAPESAAPGNIAKDEFVGWTGLPPVAVLFEYVFGLRPDVPGNKLIWDVRLTEAHGVTQYPFGNGCLLNLHCAARTSPAEKPAIQAASNLPLTLEIRWEGGIETRQL